MARKSIYLPDGLLARMRALASAPNWSRLAAEAFERFCRLAHKRELARRRATAPRKQP